LRPSRGMVVSAHPIASRAGAAVLRKGGNAVDAAVATSLMLGVVEPAFSGIGGGGFAMIYMSNGERVGLDYRETAPAMATAAMFEEDSEKNRIGPLAVATPGLLAGHARMLEEYGTMKFEDLARPATETARSGPGPSLSRQMLRKRDAPPFRKVSRFKPTLDAFVGKRRYPVLGETLARLSRGGTGEFYGGAVGGEISRYLRGMGGILSEEDIASYAPRERKPVEADCLGCRMVSMPPPSAGGTLMIQGTRVLEELEGRSRSGAGDEAVIHRAAIMGEFLKEKWRFGDPDFVNPPIDSMLSDRAVEGLADRLLSGNVGLDPSAPAGPGSTSHFSVVDREGNAVAATETIECYYGSGVTVPSLGVIMNDEMHDFDVRPGRPNSVAPGKRPASSMTPTIILKEESPFLMLGGAGSERIITSVFQTLANVLVGGVTLADAVAAPRVHPAGGRLEVEGGIRAGTVSKLREAGFKPHMRRRRDPYFGGVHAIMVDPRTGKVSGGADPRRLGAAALD
jgi:gamma-glutamyltranspeptidase / glutathione hydrolase